MGFGFLFAVLVAPLRVAGYLCLIVLCVFLSCACLVGLLIGCFDLVCGA